MRKVRHKNVVQFIGACTRKPNLCIVVEYMPGGSVYDYMRRVRVPSAVLSQDNELLGADFQCFHQVCSCQSGLSAMMRQYLGFAV